MYTTLENELLKPAQKISNQSSVSTDHNITPLYYIILFYK